MSEGSRGVVISRVGVGASRALHTICTGQIFNASKLAKKVCVTLGCGVGDWLGKPVRRNVQDLEFQLLRFALIAAVLPDDGQIMFFLMMASNCWPSGISSVLLHAHLATRCKV